MLQYFLKRRVQIYVDFIMNLVDVRDVAMGLLLAMEHGQPGQRYILGGENIALKKLLAIIRIISGRSALRIPIPAVMAQTIAAVLEFIADHVTHKMPAGTTEGVRIASRSQALSIEKARPASNWGNFGGGDTLYSRQVASIDQPQHNGRTGLQRVA